MAKQRTETAGKPPQPRGRHTPVIDPEERASAAQLFRLNELGLLAGVLRVGVVYKQDAYAELKRAKDEGRW